MAPNFLSRLVKASPIPSHRERSESSLESAGSSASGGPSFRLRSPSSPNPLPTANKTSRPPSPPLPSNLTVVDTSKSNNLNADTASLRTSSSSAGLSVTVVPPSPLPPQAALLASGSEQDLYAPQQTWSQPDMQEESTANDQTLNISHRVRTLSAPSPRPSPTEEGVMTPKPRADKSPSRSRPPSPSNFSNLKQKLKKSASNLSLVPPQDVRRKSSNKSLKQPPAPIIINDSSEVPPMPPVPATSIGTAPPPLLVSSPDKISAAGEFMTYPLSAPVTKTAVTNSSTLQAPKRDVDSMSISSAGSQGANKEKRRPWRRGSSNARKPSGLAGAIAASGLAMANPTMSQTHHNVSMIQVTESNGTSSTKTSSSKSPTHVKSRSADLSSRSPKPKAAPLLPTRRRTTNASPYSDNGSDVDGPEYLELDADSGLDDDRSGIDSDLDLDLGEDDIPVTGFAVASNKRNADFHELFSNIPEGDYLIEDYGCALQREILIQGRLYVSENHICFHANIFGWITDLSIPIYDITSLEKKMTAFVIPNGIQITTRNAKYTFASFLSRDTTFDVIYNIWRHARPDDSASIFSSARASIEDASSEQVGQANGVPKAVNRVTRCACGRQGQHYSEIAMDAVLPGTPDRIHNLIFASGFIKDFLAIEQKLTDIQVSDWTPIEPGSKLLARNMSYIKPLNGSLGPKQAKCEIRDETIHADPEDYLTMLTTTRTPDVPSGGVFSVKTRTCIMWASAITTKIVISTQVEWTGRSFIKGIIEKSAIDGQKVYHVELEKAMRAYIQEHQFEFVPAGIDPSAIELAESAAAQEAEKGGAVGQPLSQEDERRQREHERNRRGLQWAWDTFDGAFQVAKRSTKGALELVRDAWDQSSTTTILWFVIVVLVFSNLWMLLQMGRKEKVGRRKENLREEERDRWVQGVVGALRDELVGKTQPQPLMGMSHVGGGALPAVGSSSWHNEISHLRHGLDSIEDRVKLLRDYLDEAVKTDSMATMDEAVMADSMSTVD